MSYFNGNLAREAGRLADWREKFWSRRYQAIVVSEEDSAQIARLRYILAHGVKEGLVQRALDWPGLHSAMPLISGDSVEGLWVNRTKLFRAQSRGKVLRREEFESTERLELTPLPCWSSLSPSVYRQRISGLLAEIESSAEPVSTYTKPVIHLASHHDRPKISKRSPAPYFHCATEGAFREILDAYRYFAAAYRQAIERLKRGDPEPGFPEGSFLPPLAFSQIAVA
jgi:hypothetical protein